MRNDGDMKEGSGRRRREGGREGGGEGREGGEERCRAGMCTTAMRRSVRKLVRGGKKN